MEEEREEGKSNGERIRERETDAGGGEEDRADILTFLITRVYKTISVELMLSDCQG